MAEEGEGGYVSGEDEDYIPPGAEGSSDEAETGETQEQNKRRRGNDDNDVNPTATEEEKKKKKKMDQLWEGLHNESVAQPAQSTAPETVQIVQTFDFAGDDVEVTKTLKVGSPEYVAWKRRSNAKPPPPPKPKPQTHLQTGGLSGFLSRIDGKKRAKGLSTLEKSRLDWSTYKEKEGLDGELSGALKEGVGYLEKVAFLQRTDARQATMEREGRRRRLLARPPTGGGSM